MHWGWDVNWSFPHPTSIHPTPNVQGRSPPVQVKEHYVIYVNGSILVGLHPAVFDINLISNFIRIKIYISFWSPFERGIQLHCNKFSYRGILHFDRTQNIIMPDILKKSLATYNIHVTYQSVATQYLPFWRWKHCKATIIYSIIRSRFSILINYFFKRTVLNLKQLSKFINYIIYRYM